MKKQVRSGEGNLGVLKPRTLTLMTLLFLALIMGGVSTVSAADGDMVYVNGTGGNDSNNGTSWEYAKKSIKNATGIVNTNGTVHIANGIYKGEHNRGITIDRSMNIIGQSRSGTIIDAEGLSRIFLINSGVNVTINKLTLTNGYHASYGGAIYVYNGSTLNVSSSTFTGNGNTATSTATSRGGAIYVYKNGILNVNSSTFIGNIADNTGGAIYVYKNGILNVNSSTFTGNKATRSGGGAIYNDDGTASVSSSTFTGNTAGFTGSTATDGGGAIYNYYGTLNVSGSTFTGNTAIGNNTATGSVTGEKSSGGAIYNQGSHSHLNMSGSTFTGNTAASSGGAISNTSADILNIDGSTFTENAANRGGAIYNHRTDALNIVSSTFIGNTATSSGGAIFSRVFNGSEIHFSRIIDNTASEGQDIYFEPLHSDGRGSVNATYNWWGSNSDPSSRVSENVTVGPWLVLTVKTDGTIPIGGNSTITADLLHDSEGVYHDPKDGHVPDGIDVIFMANSGIINPGSASLVDGSTTSTFNASYLGTGKVAATIDDQTVLGNVSIEDKTAPTVVSFDPANGATNLAADKIIKVIFSEEIKAGSLWIELKNRTGEAVPFNHLIGGKVLTISPVSNLSESLYTLIIHTGAVTDLAGNPLALKSTKFSVGTSPTVTSMDPKNGATGVAAGKTIKVTFNENIKAGSLWIELKNSSGTAIPFTTTISGKVLTIKPKNNLAESKYKLTIHTKAVTDLAGNPVAAKLAIFSVGTSPNVTKSDPANNAVNIARNKAIKVTFNENIKAGSNYWIELKDNKGNTVNIKKSIKGKVLTITPTAQLKNNIKYRLILHTNSLTDTAGNPLALKTIYFTTRST